MPVAFKLFIPFSLFLMLMACSLTSQTIKSDGFTPVMNLLVEGSIRLDDQLLTSSQAFTGGLITVDTEEESRASVEYNNGDRIVLEYGKAEFDFFEEDDFLGAFQPQGKVAKNTNLRKIALTDGHLFVKTSRREQLSKVVYTIQTGDYTLTLKEAELNIDKTSSSIKLEVLKGSISYTSSKTTTAASVGEGESVLLNTSI